MTEPRIVTENKETFLVLKEGVTLGDGSYLKRNLS